MFHRETLKRKLYIYSSPFFRNTFSVKCEYRAKSVKKKKKRKIFSKRWKVQISDGLNKFDLKRKGKSRLESSRFCGFRGN